MSPSLFILFVCFLSPLANRKPNQAAWEAVDRAASPLAVCVCVCVDPDLDLSV